MQIKENDLQAYIRSLQELTPYPVNIDNVNEFHVLIEEQEHCQSCKGLSTCLNNKVGYHTIYNPEEDTFSLKECRFKAEDRRHKAQAELIKTLYLPKKILEANLLDFHQDTATRKKIYAKILSYAACESIEEGMYLYGPFSTGKTYTLACIANELAKKKISCLLIYFPDLVVDLKIAMKSDRFEELINMLKSIDVLMLDDLGSENMTPWLRDEILGPILNYRVLEKKAVFCTSNLTPEMLEKHLAIDYSPAGKLKAQRLISRMIGLMSAVELDGRYYQR